MIYILVLENTWDFCLFLFLMLTPNCREERDQNNHQTAKYPVSKIQQAINPGIEPFSHINHFMSFKVFSMQQDL